MSPLLSITRLGFDKDPNTLRDTVADLNGLAAVLGETIGDLIAMPAKPSPNMDRRVKALRAHRFWLMEQAEKFSQKLDATEVTEQDALVHTAASLGCDAGGRV